MPTVKLRFPGGRYHATPWGHQVNEGLIEWPPSPWRLLRALVASGFCHHGWTDGPPLARRLIEKLAAVLPLYHLPPASAAHSRHFMPIGALEKGREKTTLVFDTWANVGQGELLVHWPCGLDDEQRELFGNLVATLGYLGRSESWVEAQLTNEIVEWNAVPCVEGVHRGPGWEQVSLMAAMPVEDYQSWRDKCASETLTDPSKKVRGRSRQAARENPYPADILACLTRDTAWWKGHGWSQPPGSRRVLYWRPANPLKVSPPVVRRRPARVEPVAAMLLAITTPTGRQSPLPSVTRTLPQAEMVHRALIGILGKGDAVDCPELTGKDRDGNALTNGHQHAHILPLDLNGDRHIDHILIYAGMGLSNRAQQAVRKLRRTWTKGGVGDLQLAVVGQGNYHDLYDLPAPLDKGIRYLLGPRNGSRSWVSLTPFVAPRHLKREGKKDDLIDQVQAELRSRNLPRATVEVLPLTDDRFRHFRHFVRRRTRRSPPPADVGYALRLTFDRPQHGPLSLGYASHFGLGLMSAEGTGRKD